METQADPQSLKWLYIAPLFADQGYRGAISYLQWIQITRNRPYYEPAILWTSHILTQPYFEPAIHEEAEYSKTKDLDEVVGCTEVDSFSRETEHKKTDGES